MKISKEMLNLSVAKLRQINGLRKIVSGPRNCLKCDKKFHSKDVSNIRMCQHCREKPE